MAEHGDIARRKAFANMYIPPECKKQQNVKGMIIFTCNVCGNVLKTKKEIDDKICNNCKNNKHEEEKPD